MSQKQESDFDPYYTWLGIPPDDQPANHYRLLGLVLFEGNQEVIEVSADRQMHHLRRFQSGKRGNLVQPILQKVSAAKLCLLDSEKKAKYDAELRKTQSTPQDNVPDVPPMPQPSMGVEVAETPLSPSPPLRPEKSAAATSSTSPVLLKPAQTNRIESSNEFAPNTEFNGPLTLNLPDRAAAQKSPGFEWSRLAVPVLLLAIGVPIALILFVLFAFVIRPQSGNGVVTIHSPDSPMTILLRSDDGEQKTIVLDGSPIEMSLSAGDYEVEVVDDATSQWEVNETRFELKPGERFEMSFVEKPAQDRTDSATNPQVAQSGHTGAGQGTSELEHENNGSRHSGNSQNSHGEQNSQEEKQSDGAILNVSRMEQIEFGRPNELPGNVERAWTFQFNPKPTSADIRNGVLEFSVEKDGIVYLVTSTQYEGNRYGGWYEERLTKDDLIELGWADLGECPWRPKESLMVREVRAGERYRIRTNKYGPPQLIIPDPRGI